MVDARIADGVKTGKINERECDFIVDKVRSIVRASRPSGKRTVGIISLIGDEQSRLIRGRLLEAIGPKAFKEHCILIGDPPTFQGAERDIVFLSMVCSPGSVPTQNQLMHAQRVNVALSRARDQMVLVRSIDSNHIPNVQDVKITILDFFERVAARNSHELHSVLDNDKVATASTQSSSSHLRLQAESLLKQFLRDRGYHMRDMGAVWVGAICVENFSSGKRAGVCMEGFGEMEEEWMEVVEQQKNIERVGWKCLRVSTISFVLDYRATIDAVVRFLDSVGVLPATARVDDAVDLDSDAGASVRSQEAMEPVVAEDLERDDVIVISGDELSDTEEDSKPAALGPESVPSAEGLGNGETAADYGHIVDVDFLRASHHVGDGIRGTSASRRRAGSSNFSGNRHNESFARGARTQQRDSLDSSENVSSKESNANGDSEHERNLRNGRHGLSEDPGTDQEPALAHGFASARRNTGGGRAHDFGRAARAAGIPCDTVERHGSASFDEELSMSSFDSDSILCAIDQESAAPSQVSKRRRARLDKYSRDGRWYPSKDEDSEEEDASSPSKRRRMRIDKYSRDGRWYPKKHGDPEQEDDNMIYERLAPDEVTDPQEPSKDDDDDESVSKAKQLGKYSATRKDNES